MSEIRATTISDAAGTGPVTLTKQSAAKVFATSDTQGTVVYGFNVAGVVDDGTGQRTFNFISALADTTYSAVSTPFASTGMTHAISGRTTTSASTETDTNSGTSADRGVHLAIHGDLA